MGNVVSDIALGSVVEKVRDGATNIGILLLKVAQADATLRTHATVAAILAAANTEADFTNYARKTGITGTINVDTGAHTANVDIPDQTFTSAGGASNNTLVKCVIFYDQGGTDATRIPLVLLDCAITTNGNNLVLVINAAGIFVATG